MKTEKLELKHLAPYLPYELKYVKPEYRGKHIFDISNPTEIKIMSIFGCQIVLKNQFKPILRPLSDLTKEIEVNGEKFIPLNKLDEIFGVRYYFAAGNKGLLVKPRNTNMYVYTSIYYEINQKLFEWHFDVFNLIPENLAIDINSL